MDRWIDGGKKEERTEEWPEGRCKGVCVGRPMPMLWGLTGWLLFWNVQPTAKILPLCQTGAQQTQKIMRMKDENSKGEKYCHALMSASLNTYLSLSLNHFKSNTAVLTEPIMACKYRSKRIYWRKQRDEINQSSFILSVFASNIQSLNENEVCIV